MSAAIEPVVSAQVPAPKGHYAQAVRHGDVVYVSGQLPVGQDGVPQPELCFDEQAQIVLDSLRAILQAAGSSPRQLLKVTAYIVGIENWPRFNALYAAVLGDVRPARSVVPVPELHYGCLIEIDAIAAIHAGPATGLHD